MTTDRDKPEIDGTLYHTLKKGLGFVLSGEQATCTYMQLRLGLRRASIRMRLNTLENEVDLDQISRTPICMYYVLS